MKTFFITFILFFSLCSIAFSQSDCMYFFPKTEGTVLISTNYDPDRNIISTMTYTILKDYEYVDGSNVEIDYKLRDPQFVLLEAGRINARCEGGNFNLSMSNRLITPHTSGLLGTDTELVGDFLDYPDPFTEYPFDGVFATTAGKYEIRSKKDKNEKVAVEISNRSYEKNEKISTPAGIFDAAKVSFTVKTIKGKEELEYKGVEWYAAGAGIVRTEIYDNNKKLMNFTELTSIQDGAKKK